MIHKILADEMIMRHVHNRKTIPMMEALETAPVRTQNIKQWTNKALMFYPKYTGWL